jgi:hypothetical protein
MVNVTASIRRVICFLVLLGIALTAGVAGAVSFKAHLEPETVISGGTSILVVELSAETSSLPDLHLADLKDANVSFGGTSQQFYMAGGAMSVSKTWRWRITPLSNRDVEIPALKVTFGGSTYQTQPLTLGVTASARQPVVGTGNRTSRPDGSTDQTATDMPGPGDPHFATLKLDRSSAYVGEQVVMVFRFYQSVRAQGFDRPQYSPPRTEGFWREQIGEPQTFREARNGVTYQVTEIRYALIPTRPGALIVEPARVVIPADPFAGFFSRGRRGQPSGPKELWTTHQPLEVLDLPSPRPAGFSGLVSRQVDMTVTLDRDSVPKGEAVSAVLEIHADGSLKSTAPPTWILPDEFQVHNVGDQVHTRQVRGRLQGAYRDERIVQPLEEGHWILPAVTLSYFDTRSRAYKTLQSKRIELTATPSNFVVADGGSSNRHAAVARLGDDLVFVQSPQGKLRSREGVITATAPWWFALCLPLALLGIWRLILARGDAERLDPARRRRREALSNAQTSLRSAEQHSADSDALGEIETIIRRYVADREGRPLASIGHNEMMAYATGRLDPEQIKRMKHILDTCASSRYGQQSVSDQQDGIAPEVEQLMKDLNRARSTGQGISMGVGLLLLSVVSVQMTMAQTSAQQSDPVRLIAEGNSAYTSGNLDLALERYFGAARLSTDPLIQFNLGNTYARRGEWGLAVLNYRRAQRLAPRDQDIKSNLSRVIAQTGDRALLDQENSAVSSFIIGLQAAFTLDEWGSLLLVLIWVAGCLVAFVWWRGISTFWHRRVLLGIVAAIVMTACITALRWHDEMHVDHAVVVHDSILRSGPDESFPEVFSASEGLEVRIVDNRGQWQQVSLGGDWQGWIPSMDLQSIREKSWAQP